MVTVSTNDRCYEFRGLPTDTKPTTVGGVLISNGSIFFEFDPTKSEDNVKVYMFDAENVQWVLLD